MEKFFEQMSEMVDAAQRSPAERALSPRDFMQLAADEVDRSSRYDRPLAVAMVSVDGLSVLRKIDGSERAEQIMDHMFHHLGMLVRGPDRIARIGQSELGVMMPETTLKNATMVAERMREGLHSESGALIGVKHQLGLSVGVAALSPRVRDPKRFLMTAHFELRRAQSEGGDQVSVASADTVRLSIPRSGQIH